MAKYGPLLILEDDEDDRELYQNVLKELGLRNTIHFFDSGDALLSFLEETTEKPLVIIADINVPRMNGLELRRRIDQDEVLRKKSIPFVFLTTIESKEIVDEVYDLTVQGYFIKKPFYDDIANQIRAILEYWLMARSPNE
ncbi:Response regulator receiver domain-containing protein [Chitinophaga sp. YR627]|uniref:response regulator n=1 Tax=Chitinophaga sp. YR627 TaxID=1881041 RepID=UPI0008EA2AE0|nr:response regulator [Chitinophaga sp. YR627]SFM70633.1 Response regulator receiver domain-containing protein [Chitinophaga sp. YR627]